ncbi:hypothetical protein E4T44_03746 [Aureobasidium sp. EXF-8845]|nr:hypothetical protein E4T44_03746 [Aureobasidium sp. EXF-8845]
MLASDADGAWSYDLFQSDTDLDTVDILDDSAELDKVKQKILASPARYTFLKIEKPDDTNDKKSNADNEIDEGLIHMSLYKPAHPCRQGLPLVDPPPEGKARFVKALREYRNGIPYPFNSKGLDVTVNTGNPFYQESEIFWMELEDIPAGEEINQENTTIERIYGDFNLPVDVCGNCGAGQCDDGSKLKRCDRQVTDNLLRLYCSKTCQKAHTPGHSYVCPGFRMARKQQSGDACGNCCAKQSKDGTALKRCSRCKKRAYCSVECQKESYSAHATKCKADAAEAEAEKKDDGRVKGLDVFQTW